MPTVEQVRPYYAGADPVHDFSHILRVLALAERIGRAEGADLEILRAAALLHDAAGSAPGESVGGNGAGGRASHHHVSAEFAAQVLVAEGWPPDRIAAVQHCIRAHRFRDDREPPGSLEAKILFDCDKLDVLGAIGVARTVAYAALDGQALTGEPSERFITSGEKEPGEPHTPYHEFLFKLSKVKGRMHTATARAIAEERHRYLAEFFDRLTREVRGEA
ncbi:MAG: HD domain-containing protein [Chloroflexi bacterium]|nr:HD domain-containing protein [Chloroflexota bacterium]